MEEGNINLKLNQFLRETACNVEVFLSPLAFCFLVIDFLSFFCRDSKAFLNRIRSTMFKFIFQALGYPKQHPFSAPKAIDCDVFFPF